MSQDIAKVWKPLEDQAFADQAKFEEEALALYRKDPKKARELLTKYSQDLANKAVAAYWKLGDDLWLKYSGNF
jgi:dipeptidase